MKKEARIYNGDKKVSSISGAGKTGQLHVNKMKLEREDSRRKKNYNPAACGTKTTFTER